MARPSSAPGRPSAPRPQAPRHSRPQAGAHSRRSRRGGILGTIAALLLGSLAVAPAASAATTSWIANCGANLRATPTLSGSVKAILSAGGTITADGTVTGDAWSMTCNGDHADSTWFKVVAVNGKSTSSLYGVAAVYAATGAFATWTPPPASQYLEGIDISHWQGSVDFAKVAGAGKKFVVAKATEGIGWTDANWTKYRDGAKAAGLAVTGYHFARPDGNPTKPRDEAAWYVSQLSLKPGMLIPALDLERSGGLSKTALTAWVQAWLDEVYARTGVKAMVYTSPSFWRTYLGDTRTFADQGYNVLWIAHWGVSQPSIPASNWGGKGWTFWQYGGGPVPGISGDVDLDKYNGTDLTKVTYGADFGLAAAASLSSTVKQGGSTTFDISINRTFFTLPIALSVTGAPAGTTATLSTGLSGGSSVTLSVTTSKSGTVTPTGTYTLTVTGGSNGLTRSTTVPLVVTDGIAPVASAPGSKLYSVATLGSTTSPVKSSWSATDEKGVQGYTLQYQVDGGSWAAVNLPSSMSVSVAQSQALGGTFRYRLQASDANGNKSAWAYGPTFTTARVQQSSTAVTYSGTWTTGSSTTYSGGTTKYTKASGASVSYTFNGSSIAWVSSRSSARGSASVYIDGVYQGTVSLYASTYQAQRIVYAYNWSSNGTHTIRIVNKATSGHPRIDVDAFVSLARG